MFLLVLNDNAFIRYITLGALCYPYLSKYLPHTFYDFYYCRLVLDMYILLPYDGKAKGCLPSHSKSACTSDILILFLSENEIFYIDLK